jgi:hypothetical protein
MLLDSAVQCVADGGILMVTATGVYIYHGIKLMVISSLLCLLSCRYGQSVRKQPHQLLVKLR